MLHHYNYAIRFSKCSFHEQEVEPGTNVTQIDASSSDPNNKLTFSFVINDELNSDASRFHIDPDTGRITVRDRLDRETQGRYQV